MVGRLALAEVVQFPTVYMHFKRNRPFPERSVSRVQRQHAARPLKRISKFHGFLLWLEDFGVDSVDSRSVLGSLGVFVNALAHLRPHCR